MSPLTRLKMNGDDMSIARICSLDGCGGRLIAREMCGKHYQEWRKKNRSSTAPIERHGMTESSEYKIWGKMRDRCNNPASTHYRNYGGRGIKVCERWQHSFLAFYEDIGPRPDPSYSIDRIDNDGNYEPGNVKWATRHEQAINQRVRANRSGFTGVYYDSEKKEKQWRAFTRHKNQNYELGYYSTAEEAYAVYKLARASLLANDCLPESLKHPCPPNSEFNPRIHSPSENHTP